MVYGCIYKKIVASGNSAKGLSLGRSTQDFIWFGVVHLAGGLTGFIFLCSFPAQNIFQVKKCGLHIGDCYFVLWSFTSLIFTSKTQKKVRCVSTPPLPPWFDTAQPPVHITAMALVFLFLPSLTQSTLFWKSPLVLQVFKLNHVIFLLRSLQ